MVVSILSARNWEIYNPGKRMRNPGLKKKKKTNLVIIQVTDLLDRVIIYRNK